MPSTKPFLKEQFRKLSALRNAPTDSVAVAAIAEQWERVLSQVGEYRFASGVNRCLAANDFFPSVPELELFIPRSDEQRTVCHKCRNSEGFEYCEIKHPVTGLFSKGVRKCTHDA